MDVPETNLTEQIRMITIKNYYIDGKIKKKSKNECLMNKQ